MLLMMMTRSSMLSFELSFGGDRWTINLTLDIVLEILLKHSMQ